MQDVSTLQMEMETLGEQARQASRVLALSSDEVRNQALRQAATSLRDHRGDLLSANQQDMEGGRQRGLTSAQLDRLLLTDARIEGMAKGLEEVALLPDPVGRILAQWTRPNGLHISRVSVPLGVIGIIYESRPNVTADAGGLCLKSGNAAILRGGSESFFSSLAILEYLQAGLRATSLPPTCIQSVPTRDREVVGILLKMNRYIDVIVPRGGKSLISRVMEESRIPLFQHLDGLCHTYVHTRADVDMAVNVTLNAKMRRTGICGATETLLIDRAVLTSHLPSILAALRARGCEIRGDKDVQILDSNVAPATDQDWDTEYLDAILSVKVVEDLGDAIHFVNQHGSHHTDAIVTDDQQAAERFLKEVDSAIVLHNGSTQFADGGEFGMGAEIGIATGKLHARGPVGVEQLTTFKYQVRGTGQVRGG